MLIKNIFNTQTSKKEFYLTIYRVSADFSFYLFKVALCVKLFLSHLMYLKLFKAVKTLQFNHI